jgi:hypothetical protein
MNKFRVGDRVLLGKIFSPTITAEGTNYDTSRGYVVVIVTAVQNSASLGYCYKLESPEGLDLGGVLYWESDLLSIHECEDELWKAWGDK